MVEYPHYVEQSAYEDGLWRGITVRQRRNEKAKVLHCEKCGASHYDDGFHTDCPFCKIEELKKEIDHLNDVIDYSVYDNER